MKVLTNRLYSIQVKQGTYNSEYFIMDTSVDNALERLKLHLRDCRLLNSDTIFYVDRDPMNDVVLSHSWEE